MPATDSSLLVEYTNQSTGLSMPSTISREELIRGLQGYVQDLLSNNFSRLIQLLYRMDVSEKQLRALLLEQVQTDAALIISQLIVDRQQQKINSRSAFNQNSATIPEDEKW